MLITFDHIKVYSIFESLYLDGLIEDLDGISTRKDFTHVQLQIIAARLIRGLSNEDLTDLTDIICEETEFGKTLDQAILSFLDDEVIEMALSELKTDINQYQDESASRVI